jgi:protein involved in polysaccharide export with SLBB domain
MRTTISAAILVTCLALVAPPLEAQRTDNWDPERVYMSRDDLRQLLGRLEQTVNSSAYSSKLRNQARDQAELIRIRLEEGDFQVGDRVLLTVEEEPALTDTFTVTEDRTILFPDIGPVSLAGLLRAELEFHISTYLERFLREPKVVARSLIPITVVGGVVRPGFYTVPSQQRLDDVLMIAGGPAATAKITEIRVERGRDVIWDVEPLQEAITAGRTLDQLNLRAGDRVLVPLESEGIFGGETNVRTITLLLSIPLSIVAILAIF